MKLDDVDKLAELKQEWEKVAAIEQQARRARAFGVTTPRAGGREADARTVGEMPLMSATGEELFVEQVRAAVLDWCGRRRHSLHSALKSYGVEVEDSSGESVTDGLEQARQRLRALGEESANQRGD